MSIDPAEQVAELINTHSSLVEPVFADQVRQNDYCIVLDGDAVVGCAKTSRVSWYQAEISHLVIRPEHRKRGLARNILGMACDKARGMNLKVAQCTIRRDNAASETLFYRSGFQLTLVFTGLSGKPLGLWQKAL